MIKILGMISGIICTIMLFINLLLYLLKDIYFKINKISIRKLINRTLPFLSKNNRFFVGICFISFLIYSASMFRYINFFNFNILISFLLIIIITFDFPILKHDTYCYLRKITSYLIIIFLLFHIYFIYL